MCECVYVFNYLTLVHQSWAAKANNVDLRTPRNLLSTPATYTFEAIVFPLALYLLGL